MPSTPIGGAPSAHLGLDHLTDRAQHVSQTLLLSHSRQSPRIVASSSVGHHHSRIVARNNLPDLLVTVTTAHLVHSGIIGLERHQKGTLSANSPACVVSVDHRALTHRLPKPLVRISHSAPRSSQSVLRDRALAQLNSGQRSEHDGNPPHRYAHSIVEHVSRSHHSSSHPMGARTVLVRSNVPMTPSHTPAARHASAYLHPVLCHLRSGHRGNVGHVRKALSLMFEYASTSGGSFPLKPQRQQAVLSVRPPPAAFCS